MATFDNVTVKEKKQETANAVSVVFDIPENLKENFSFISGQYITLKALIDNKEVRRAYSICSSPRSGELRVAIKKVKNGTFSVYATEQLNVGDAIEISTPEGKFQLEPKPKKNYIGFAAGSGITPILSMVKAVLETEETATFTLIYGNKSVKETIFFNGFLDVTASKGAGQDGKQFHYNQRHGVGEFWCHKIDQNGNLVWRRYFGGTSNDRSYDAIETTEGDFVLVGASESQDVDISDPRGSYDAWIVKLNAGGDLIWERSFGGSEYDGAQSILENRNGDYVVMGQTYSEDEDIKNAKGSSDIFLAFYSKVF